MPSLKQKRKVFSTHEQEIATLSAKRYERNAWRWSDNNRACY